MSWKLSRRALLLGTVSLLCLPGKSRANFAIFQVSSPSSSAQAQIMRLGAGGWIRGMDIALSDNTMVCNTDTYGAYYYNSSAANPGNAGGTGSWQQLVTTQSMPNGDPALTLSARQAFGPLGVYDIRIAPSSTSTFYMVWMGYVYKSTNKGSTWTNLNASFTPIALAQNDPNQTGGSGSGDATFGPKMVVDPINASVVYLGLQGSGGAWYSFNGGTSWTQISTGSVPNPTPSSYAYVWAYDPRVSKQSGGVSTLLYCCVNGVGCYVSANAGSGTPTWTKISGSGTSATSVTAARNMKVDSLGNLWVITDASSSDNCWVYNGTSWSQITTGVAFTGQNYVAVDFDPNVSSANRVFISGQLGMCVQSTGGVSGPWNGGNGGGNQGTPTYAATDIPYLGVITDTPTCSKYLFDNASNLWEASGVGIFKGSPGGTFSGSSFPMNSVSAAIEQLVGNRVISPPGGSACCSNWDRAFFQVPNPHRYATTDFPTSFSTAPGGCSIDWASANPSTIVGVQSFGGVVYSSNGGSSWNNATSNITSASACCICAASSTNWLAMGSAANLQYTTNGGANWNDLGSYFNTNFSVPTSSMVVNNASGSPDQTVCADRVTASTFYAFVNLSAGNGGGIYSSSNGGAAWTKQISVSSLPSFVGQHPMLRSVYGKAGHLILCGGQTNQGIPPTHPYTSTTNCLISTNGGASWADLSATARDIWGIDTGLTVGSYPRIYIWGYVNVSGTWTEGVFYSDDQGSTWTQIATQEMWGTLDVCQWLEADKNTAGQFYIARSGSGYDYYGV